MNVPSGGVRLSGAAINSRASHLMSLTLSFIFGLSLLTVLAVIAWLCALVWLRFAGLALQGITTRKPLARAQSAEPASAAPLVSVIVPARNEAHRILDQSVRSILAQDYENLEVIAINDRSTDATESVLRSIAETDARLRVINGVETPEGWRGKPYALQQALEASRGEWVLTVDADMMLEREAVSTAVEKARAGNFEVLTLMPHLETGSFWERIFTSTWVFVLLGTYPFMVLNNPKTKQAMAFGGFSLIRRDALGRIGDFGAVRAEVNETVRLAELLKASGAAYRIEHGPNLIRTRMQNNFAEVWEFLSRSMFSGLGHSVPLALLSVFIGYIFAVAPPFVAAFCALMIAQGIAGEWLRLLIPTLLIWIMQVVTLLLICKNFRIPGRYALTTPLGFALFYSALLSSAVNAVFGRGATWKERKV